MTANISHRDDTKIAAVKATLFEDALDLTGVGRYTYRLALVCVLLLWAMALDIFGTSFVVTSSQCDFGLSTENKGLLGALPMLAIILSAHMWGYVADTRGRRATLVVSMAGSCVFSWLSSLSPHWLVFAVLKFCSAFFASASNAVVYALLGESIPADQRNKFLLLISSGLMFGQGVIGIIAYPTLQAQFSYQIIGITYRPWRLLIQIYGLASCLGLLAVLLLLHESPKFYISRGKEEDSLKVLRAMFVSNTGKKAEEYPVKSLLFLETTNVGNKTGVLRSMWLQTAPLFQGALLKNTLIIMYIVIVVYSIPPTFMMWMPTITNAYSRALSRPDAEGLSFCTLLNSEMNHNVSQIEEPNTCDDKIEEISFICVIAFGACTCALNTIISFLIKFVGKKNMVIGFNVLAGVCGLVLNSVHSLVGSVLMFYGFQLNVIVMGLATSFTVQVYPTYLRAMGVCLTMMVGRGASFLFINFTGVLMERYCEYTFYAFGAFVLSGASVAVLLPPDYPEEKTNDKSDNTTPPERY